MRRKYSGQTYDGGAKTARDDLEGGSKHAKCADPVFDVAFGIDPKL